MPGCSEGTYASSFFLKPHLDLDVVHDTENSQRYAGSKQYYVRTCDGLDGTRSNPGEQETPHTRSPAPQDSQCMTHIPSHQDVCGCIISSCSRKVKVTRDMWRAPRTTMVDPKVYPRNKHTSWKSFLWCFWASPPIKDTHATDLFRGSSLPTSPDPTP